MAIAHVANASTAQNDTSSPFTQEVTIPAGASIGQFALYFVVAATNIAIGTPTSAGSGSWTPAYAEQTIGTVARHRTWWKFLTSGDPGANAISTMGTTGKTAGSVRVYSGVDTTTPIVVSPTILNDTVSSTTTVAPAITADDFYVSFAMHRGTAPTTPTNGGLANVAGATQSGAGTAAVAGGDSNSDLDGGTTWTSTASTGRCAVSIALNELVVAAALPPILVMAPRI